MKDDEVAGRDVVGGLEVGTRSGVPPSGAYYLFEFWTIVKDVICLWNNV